MTSHVITRWAAAALVCSVGFACAGDGTGLDQWGNPLDTSMGQLTNTLSSIQVHVFSAICTECHTGASAPLGLALDSGVSRQNLVNVASSEDPTMMRILSGQPDSSYLVWKIEGRTSIVGGQMPLGYPPLSASQVEAIRAWILGGALNN